MTTQRMRIVLAIATFVVAWNFFPMLTGMPVDKVHHIPENFLTGMVSITFIGGLIVGMLIGWTEK